MRDRWPVVAGLGVTAVAGLGLDGAAHRSLTGHMVQHVVLWAVAAPLLAFGVPLRHDDDGWLARVAVAAGVQAAVLWAWHAPAVFDAALDHPPLHAVEHLTLVAASALFLRAVAGGGRHGNPAASLAVFVAAFPGTALGAALLLAPRPWYPVYDRLPDQQLAGVVMWAGMGMLYVLAAVILFARSLADPV